MSALPRQLLAAARILNQLPDDEGLAIDRWNNGTAFVEDIDRFLDDGSLHAHALAIVSVAMPYRRLLRAGRDVPIGTGPASILGQLAAYSPSETPPPKLVERLRGEVDSPPGLGPDGHQDRMLFVIGRGVLGADDGLPFRQAMAAGTYGPEAAADAPPVGFGAQYCPIGCGFRGDPNSCVCTGRSDELSVEVRRRDEQERSREAQRPTPPVVAPKAATSGQTRPPDTESHAGEAIERAEPEAVAPSPEPPTVPYSEPGSGSTPPVNSNRNREQTLRPAHRRSGRW
jgi:hypothetical protein